MLMRRMMQLRRKRQAYHKCSKLYVLFDTPIREPMQLNRLEPSLTGDKILSSKSAIELKQFLTLKICEGILNGVFLTFNHILYKYKVVPVTSMRVYQIQSSFRITNGVCFSISSVVKCRHNSFS